MQLIETLRRTETLTVEDINKEIQDRNVLIGQMCGELYPRIIAGEIEELIQRRNALLNGKVYRIPGEGEPTRKLVI